MSARSEADYLGTAYPFTRIRQRLRRHPRPYLDFALGREQDPPPDWLAEVLREHAGLAARRATADETDAFVERAVALLGRVYGVSVSPAAVLPAAGGRAAMSALATALLGSGDHVLVTEPGYPAFARIAAQLRARITAVPLDPEAGFEPVLAGVADAPDDRIRLAALNVPNNPTGAVTAPTTLAALRERLETPGWVFNDAVYGPLTYDREPFSMLADDDGALDDAVVELHSLGKLFSLGPLGVAFLVGSDEPIARVREFCDFASTQLSSLQLVVATRCLTDWAHVERMRERLRRRVDALRDAVRAVGFDPFPTAAGMYLLCRAPSEVSGRRVASALEAADVLLDEHGVAVAPWDVPPNRYLRFSAAYRPDELEALASLGRNGSPVSY